MSVLTPQQVKSIPDLYQSGLSQRAISQMFGCTHRAIQKHLAKHNLIMRPCGFPDKEKCKVNMLIRKSIEVRDWKKRVMARDNYQCKECGAQGYLEIDHIIPLSYLITKYSMTKDNYKNHLPIIVDDNNGKTLCKPCHRLTPTYKKNALKFNMD